MKILITGAAGFLGTNLSLRLLNEGHEVIGVDNLYSGSERNLKQLENHSRFRFVRHDIRKPLERKTIGEVNQIYHLACPASPPIYQKDHQFTFDSSVDGTRNALAFARENNAVMLFSSTSEVYGNPKKHPQTEDYNGNVNPVGERSCYDEGKRAAETCCYIASKTGVDVRIARIFNTYGPFMDPKDGRVVSNFINQALRNEPITIYGDGSQTRSFCYVSDLIEGLVKLMNHKKAHSEEDVFGPINLGNPDEFTVYELAKKVLGLIPDSKSKIDYFQLPSDDPVVRRPDISKAIKILGWEPKIRLDEGLERTIEYFKTLKEAE